MQLFDELQDFQLLPTMYSKGMTALECVIRWSALKP